MKSHVWTLLFASLMTLLSPVVSAEEPTIEFTRDIRPILSSACFRCHGPDEAKREADLRLDTKDGVFAVHDGSAAVVPGDLSASELYERILSIDADEQMPPADSERQLTTEEKQLLRRWIEQGAPWEKHWSFRPPKKSVLPKVQKSDWVREPLDHFVLARLEQERLQPSSEASREALIRRVSFDLTGLPPTLQEIDAFLQDSSLNAYEKVVDRLLASPRYGERMALDWLDVSRYADTHGYHVDSGRDMWLWRDWVIRAFNKNMPFDQFAIEQLAGDLLPKATHEQKIATGFNRNHGINFEGGAFAEEFQVEYVVDRVHTTSTVFMGLTMKCARCHDHKFDPISQKEYYQFFSLFNTIPERGIDGALGNAMPVIQEPSKQQTAEALQLRKERADWDKLLDERKAQTADEFTNWVSQKEVAAVKTKDAKINEILALAAEKRTTDQTKKLREHFLKNHDKQYQELFAKDEKVRKEQNRVSRSIPSSMVMREMEKPRETFVLIRGQYDQHGEKVSPAVPGSLPPMPQGAEANRLGLAKWLVDPSHPLTSRVTVNRFWQSLFGTGLVKTAENFGSEGNLPSHPQLLDHLALEFIASGWDVKALMRRIVLSATYRQSSRVTPELVERDPENRLFARASRFRLPAELIRDNAMAVSGLLVNKIGGPSVRPYQPAGIWDEVAFGIKSYSAQVYVQDHGDALYRRGMYTFWKRSCPPPSLLTFDAPEREVCTVRRDRTNTPLQALVLLNDPTFVEASRALAGRIIHEAGPTVPEKVVFAFRLATARKPNSAEQAILERAFRTRLAEFQRNPKAATTLLEIGESPRNEKVDVSTLAAWTMVARMLLNLDETITKG